MINLDLLSTVQPVDGWFAITGIRNGKVRQQLVATTEEVQELSEQLLAADFDVYFGVAKYKTDANRTKDNVQALRAFWLDIDCGDAKAVPNAKTGIAAGYATQADAFHALRTFCADTGLPSPTVVNSGRGVHVYWPLNEDVTREQWEPVATALYQLCLAHGMLVDAAVFEVARILRIPGTLNFKDNPPQPVTLLRNGTPVSLASFAALVGIVPATATPSPPPLPKNKRPLTELGQAMQNNIASSFAKIMARSAAGDGCQQLLDCHTNQATLPEPRWFDALSIAKFCTDKDTAIHTLSDQHPGYNAATTEAKLTHIVGPHTCAVFENNNPGGCAKCPFAGKFKSPITLGNEVLEATAEDNLVTDINMVGEFETYTIPDYPRPFVRGANGGIYKLKEDGETDDVMVYEHDLFVVKRMRDPMLGDVVVFRHRTPKDGTKEFVVPNIKVTDPAELRKALSAEGVICNLKAFALLTTYIYLSIKILQKAQKAELMRLQFGWADNDSTFIVGDREISKDGIIHSPPSSNTAAIAKQLIPMGTLEKWKEVFALYGRPGMEAHAFAALTGFGAALFKFTGQSGAIINIIHSESGTGKTTALHMVNSIWGNPRNLCATKDDTLNAKMMRLGIMRNLPFCVDEITNTSAKEFSTLIYGISQGRGKDRVKQHSNELRTNVTTWQTMALCSSNASFYEKMPALKANPDGELMRLFEYKIEKNDVIDPQEAKQMFDHQLMENYGHAGPIFAQWLVSNAEEAKDTLLAIQTKLDREMQFTQRERFWSAKMASNLAAGLAAKSLDLIDWDMKRIYNWAATAVKDMRLDNPVVTSDASAVIGGYINSHMQNILVVNGNLDMRSNMYALPVLEPRGELLIRFEPDTAKLFISSKEFRNYCVEYQINYKDTMQRLTAKGAMLGTLNKRMAKGTKINSPGVHTLVFDTSVGGFLDMGVIESAVENEGGEDQLPD